MSGSRVVIADDHAAIRAGVRAALEGAGFEVVADVGDAASAVAACIEHDPDICLLDIDMPGNGISACRSIRTERPSIAVVMLTVSIDDDDLFDALTAGASGYLLKTTAASRLGDALRGVLAGEAALPRTLVAKVITEFRNRRGRRFHIGPKADSLTDREWDVLELLAEELSTKEIGARLFLSPITVRTHTNSIIKKLGVPDRSGVIEMLRSQRN